MTKDETPELSDSCLVVAPHCVRRPLVVAPHCVRRPRHSVARYSFEHNCAFHLKFYPQLGKRYIFSKNRSFWETDNAGRRRSDAAFTLTEVVVAAVLMLLSLGLLLSTFVSARRSVAIMQNYLTAQKMAASEAERLQTNVYASISNSPAWTTFTNAFIVYQLSNSVVTNNNYKDVRITVQWTAPVSARRQALTNYITICNTN